MHTYEFYALVMSLEYGKYYVHLKGTFIKGFTFQSEILLGKASFTV